MVDFSKNVGVHVAQVLHLSHDASTPEVVRAHCELATAVRRHAEESSTYAEHLVQLAFQAPESEDPVVESDSDLAKLIVARRWGEPYRDRSDQGLDRCLEVALAELAWGLQIASPNGLLTHAVLDLLDEHRRENAQRWLTTISQEAARWSECLLASESFRVPSTDPSLELGWGDVATEFVNWRFSANADPAYWMQRNELLLTALGSFQHEFVNDLAHGIRKGLPKRFAKSTDFVRPINFVNLGGRYLETPTGPPDEYRYPVDLPGSEFEWHRYRAQIIQWLDACIGDAVAWATDYEEFERRDTSLDELHNLRLPRTDGLLK